MYFQVCRMLNKGVNGEKLIIQPRKNQCKFIDMNTETYKSRQWRPFIFHVKLALCYCSLSNVCLLSSYSPKEFCSSASWQKFYQNVRWIFFQFYTNIKWHPIWDQVRVHLFQPTNHSNQVVLVHEPTKSHARY